MFEITFIENSSKRKYLLFDCHKYSNWRQSGANDRMSMPLHLSIINSYWYNELFCMQTVYCLQF